MRVDLRHHNRNIHSGYILFNAGLTSAKDENHLRKGSIQYHHSHYQKRVMLTTCYIPPTSTGATHHLSFFVHQAKGDDY